MPTIYQGTSGLNTKYDPFRLSIPSDSIQIRALNHAVNVKVSNLSSLSRVKGFSLFASGDYRDIYCNGGDCLIVKADELHRVMPNLTTVSLTKLSNKNAPMSYLQTPFKNRIYWTNGNDCGYYVENSVYDWNSEGRDTYVRQHPDRIVLPSPPKGNLLELLNGRIYVASGNVVWISERFLPGIFWADGRQIFFPTNVTLLGAVADGLWVSDETAIYWINGVSPKSQTLAQKTDYPAKFGRPVKVSSDLLGDENLLGAGLVLAFATRKGLCIAGPGGYFLNLTQSALETENPPWPFNASRCEGIIFEDQIYYTLCA